MIGRLKELPLMLRSLVYVFGALLVFFAAFGVGASAWVAWQGELPTFLADRSRRLEGGGATSPPRGEGPTRPYTTVSSDPADAGPSESTTPEATGGAEKTIPGEPAQPVFVHRATEENSRGDYTYLDVPSINGDPGAIVFVEPLSGEAYGHNIGVWYEFVDRKRWAIFNQDRTPVPAGSGFEVVVPPETESFVHRSTPENTSANATRIDDPLTNGRPDAEVSVTQNWNPGGGGGVYNDHAVGVRYDEGRGRWTIFNEDLAPIKTGVAFNVSAPSAE